MGMWRGEIRGGGREKNGMTGGKVAMGDSEKKRGQNDEGRR